MKTKKLEALEAVVAALEISDSELKNWFNIRFNDQFIPTELPIVYCKSNKIEVLNGLDLSRKQEVWGIQLLSGVKVALKCGAGNNVSSTTWYNLKQFAETITFNGKSGTLPSQKVLSKHSGDKEREVFDATVKVLKNYGIDADGYKGAIWCSERETLDTAYVFGLDHNYGICIYKSGTFVNDRIAVTFD